MKFKMVFLLIFILLPINVFANSGFYEECYYETGDRIKISVFAEVSNEIAEPFFSYHYSLKSDPDSTQNVWVLKIILPVIDIINSAGSPVGWEEPGWVGKQTKYSLKRTKNPPFWITWPAPEGKDIQPSETLSGFVFKTFYGLPGIVDYYAEGNAYAWCPEGMAEDFIPGYHDLTPYGPGIVGKTIGSKPIPADFKSVDFVDYMISIKHEASSLGWITNKGIENSLDSKLDNAKTKIEEGNITAAKNILDAFLNEVEAQNKKHLTSEAYALLKYNVQYLLERL